MSLFALALILTSAVAHACWNLLSKQAADGVVFVWMVAAASTAVWTPVAPIMLNYFGDLGRTLVLTAPVLGGRRRSLILPIWREQRTRVLGAAVLMPLSYLLALTAFTFSPISAVAPVREVSVLVAVLLGGRLLAEGDLTRRLLAACVIVGGVVTIALS
ncbi:hypothetical protein OG884_19430 [Streptosporangium sp. NBC_01755]|uniref:hypothetical protein n=1 Tax=Streptosporangium sp. NBC_01755 TaxID=2975949 RepID=UPI002DD9D24B|nr:hypothetical protein [Streptosporangium sp. NBC_01755]WSD03981.1 hypothetical protein OG884_19430 [Streptosporangium sp. NBC_01755]